MIGTRQTLSRALRQPMINAAATSTRLRLVGQSSGLPVKHHVHGICQHTSLDMGPTAVIMGLLFSFGTVYSSRTALSLPKLISACIINLYLEIGTADMSNCDGNFKG